MMHVGFIGLGSQGGPMAGRIIDAGSPTTLWARRPASLEPFIEATGEFVGKDIAVVRGIAAELGSDLGVLDDVIDAGATGAK